MGDFSMRLKVINPSWVWGNFIFSAIFCGEKRQANIPPSYLNKKEGPNDENEKNYTRYPTSFLPLVNSFSF
jgi:hypothetical protein